MRRNALEYRKRLAVLVIVVVLRFQHTAKQQPHKQDKRNNDYNYLAENIQRVSHGGKIPEEILFRCPKPPIRRPVNFKFFPIIWNRNGRNGGNSGNVGRLRREIKKRYFRQFVYRQRYAVRNLEDFAKIIRYRKPAISYALIILPIQPKKRKIPSATNPSVIKIQIMCR